ncbi:hypothetical protein BKA62DRAFT_691143 [Auriculariales sp. MPI-PUGE-AT-0066]|nr:hypothetical protein BKA62DRAFT_691143 [Auriculariales sp. MPI-PUGE-AT-0066]
MLHRANVAPFALGAAVAFILSAAFQWAPSSSFSFPGPHSTSVGQTTISKPLDGFREAWTLLGSPEPSTKRFASSPSRVCIMAADTRPITPVNSSTIPSELDFRTFAVYHNLWWALRHGYNYRMVHTERIAGYSPIWSKTHAIRKLVSDPTCELVVFFDSDAYVTQPSYSLYDLLDRWNFHERAAMLLSMDQPFHPMPQNQNATNTGFMVFRSGAKAIQILDDILACPEKIPECAQWKTIEKYEQTAFNLFVRPHLVEGEELIIIPCDDANGNFKNQWCHGKFVTHAWHALETVNERAAAIMIKETFAWLSQVFDGERVTIKPELPVISAVPVVAEQRR